MASEELHRWLAFDPDQAQRVVTRFLSSTVQDAGTDGVVLGLSGGLDSALVAALATQALGDQAVDVVFLPGPSSAEEDRASAQDVAEHLGLRLAEASIETGTDALAKQAGVEADRVLVGNLQARLRMAVLYARAKATSRLVAGTGNKSELLVGYFTKHGDGGVDLLPIGDLYKSQVRVLAGQMGLPDAVIERPPSAGLWEGQSDEEELGMGYATLDVILAGFERQADPDTISQQAAVPLDEVERVRTLVRRTWHKRNPPPVPKLGWRTVGVDWREPTM